MSRRRLTTALVSLVLLTGSGPPALATPERPGPAPLLWAGRVVDRHGQPAPGLVSAFIRPPASVIPALNEHKAAPASIPLATAEAGPDGRFELRAEAPAIPPEYRPDGWIHVMLLAEGAGGWWSIATDSVRYLPAGGSLAAPVWLSNLVSAERAEELRSSGGPRAEVIAAIDRLGVEELAGGMERPTVIQLGEPRAQAAGPPTLDWKGPGDPYTGCSARYVEDRQKGLRTISDIDVAKDWSFHLEYTDTGTTAWDVGYEASGGNWKVGGTASFSNTAGRGFNSDFGPFPERYQEAFQVDLWHAKVLWECNSKESSGRFPVRTVEPESWTGSTFNQGDPMVSCTSTHERTVARDTMGWRESGKSSKYSAGASVFGFSGQAAVTYNKTIKLGWRNHQDHPRVLCGESADPYLGDTRVAAMPV